MQKVVHLLPCKLVVDVVVEDTVTTERPKSVVDRMSVFFCTEFMAISIGMVTNFSISSADRPGHCVMIVTLRVCDVREGVDRCLAEAHHTHDDHREGDDEDEVLAFEREGYDEIDELIHCQEY